MITQHELIQSVNIICKSIVEILESIIDQNLDEIDYDVNSVGEFLTQYQELGVTELLTSQFQVDVEKFMNLDVIHSPIRYLACYILLNADINKIT